MIDLRFSPFLSPKVFSPEVNMSDPFLALPGTKRKRPSRPDRRPPRPDKSQQKSKSASKRRLRDASPEADSDDEIGPGGIESDIDHEIDKEDTDESDNEETPAERRLRLAKEYLEKVKREARMAVCGGY